MNKKHLGFSHWKRQAPKCPNPPRPAADRQSIEDAFEILKQSKSPLVIVGKGKLYNLNGTAKETIKTVFGLSWFQGCSYGHAEKEAKKFIEKYQLPFLATPMGKGTLDDRHPLAVGAARSTALQAADCIVLLGARLNWMLHFGKAPRFNPNVKIIQVKISKFLFSRENSKRIRRDSILFQTRLIMIPPSYTTMCKVL